MVRYRIVIGGFRTAPREYRDGNNEKDEIGEISEVEDEGRLKLAAVPERLPLVLIFAEFR